MTPAAVHHAQQLDDRRAQVAGPGYVRNPKRLVRTPPAPPGLSTTAWITKPD